jgi:enoyl-CoA hydratase/carnithine racemase
MARMFLAIARCRKPVVGRIHGHALGGGTGLTAAVDVALCTEDCQFGLTEVKLGIVPAVISPFVLQKIGAGRARTLFLTGERFDGKEAQRIGLVHRALPDGPRLDAAVKATIDELLSSGPLAGRRLLVATRACCTGDGRSLAGRGEVQDASAVARCPEPAVGEHADSIPLGTHRLLVLCMLATHAAGALLLLLVQEPDRFGVQDASARATLWTLAWMLWCIADLFSPAFVLATLRRRAPGSRARRLLLVLIGAAAVPDLALNACYAAFGAPAPAGTGPITDPTLRFLSLTVTNGLFLAAYLVLSAALRRRVPRWLTLLGLPAWTGAFGLCLEGAGLVSGASTVSGALLVAFFCAWLLGLLCTDGT